MSGFDDRPRDSSDCIRRRIDAADVLLHTSRLVSRMSCQFVAVARLCQQSSDVRRDAVLSTPVPVTSFVASTVARHAAFTLRAITV